MDRVEISRKPTWRFVALVCAVTGLLCIVVGVKKLSLGVSGEWVWPYAKTTLWDRAWVPCCYLALMAGVLGATLRKKELAAREAVVGLALLVLFAFGLQLAAGYLSVAGLHEGLVVTLGPWMGGYHLEAVRAHNLGQYLASYPETLRAMSVKGALAHVSNHPPGYVVFYWVMDGIASGSPSLTDAVLRAAAYLAPVEANVGGELGIELSRSQEAGVWMACLSLRLIVCLAIVPVYLLGRRVCDSRAALAAAAFAAVVPAFHLFSPYPDAIIILLGPIVICLWDKALDGKAILFGALAGAVFFAATFFSLAVVVLGPLGAVICALRLGQPESRRRLFMNGLKAIGAGAAAFVGLGAILWLTTGCNIARVFLVCFEKHSEFYAAVPRTYWKWVIWNLIDFGLFVGAPLTIMALRELGLALWSVTRYRLEETSFPLIIQNRILVAVALTIIILDLAGLNRGEAGRLWLVFMPFFCLGASSASADGCRRLLALFAAQFVQVCVFKLCLDVFGFASLV